MIYLGDFASQATVDFMWSTNAADGSSITRATNGTVSVYKANSTTQTTTGVTDTEDFDSLTGIHHCRIVTTDAFYATGNTYIVVLSGATIDGKTVNAVLAHFSIENRYNPTPPAASAIADAVWDEATSGHTTAGSTGKALTDANNGAPPAASAIADAVWDEATSGHTTAGTAGKALTDANNGAPPTAAENATAVWAAGSRTLSTAPPTAAAIADAVWDESLGAHLTGDSTGEALFNAGSSIPPSAATIADAVWDEATSGHTTAGSTGKALTDANNGAAPTAADNATAVWGAGSRTLTSSAAPTAAAIADAVWDESLGSHLTADSTGEALFAAGSSTADPWNVALPGAYASGKAGWILGTRLDAQVSSVAPGGEAGAGGSQFTYTLTEAGTGTPIADADIWASTDSAGQTIVASGRTNQQGQVIFWLDPGTVYIWRQKTGWNFTNPDVETVA